MAEGDIDSRFPLKFEGPKAGVKYPIKVQYVEVCDNWPVEYCEFHPNYEQAKEWMRENLTDDMKEMYLSTEGADSDEPKKRQKRGGKGQVKTKKKDAGPKGIKISQESRGKKKFTTVVTGIASYGIDLKVASKFFGSRFACGSSVTGEDEISIQGKVADDLYDIIPEKWKEIPEDDIE